MLPRNDYNYHNIVSYDFPVIFLTGSHPLAQFGHKPIESILSVRGRAPELVANNLIGNHRTIVGNYRKIIGRYRTIMVRLCFLAFFGELLINYWLELVN